MRQFFDLLWPIYTQNSGASEPDRVILPSAPGADGDDRTILPRSAADGGLPPALSSEDGADALPSQDAVQAATLAAVGDGDAACGVGDDGSSGGDTAATESSTTEGTPITNPLSPQLEFQGCLVLTYCFCACAYTCNHRKRRASGSPGQPCLESAQRPRRVDL